jgi:hypothetical protein
LVISTLSLPTISTYEPVKANQVQPKRLRMSEAKPQDGSTIPDYEALSPTKNQKSTGVSSGISNIRDLLKGFDNCFQPKLLESLKYNECILLR